MNDVKEAVKKTYTKVLETANDCGCSCGPSCCSPSESSGFNEKYDHLEGYSKEADYGMGCGIPTQSAKIKEGDTVLDLGSGAGNDAFVARRIVGSEGRVIGVDMTEAMIKKARENAQKLGYDNAEFLLGEIENLPLQDDEVDIAISNCVMNLVPDKALAYQEVYRVLKPGGHFSISDIVLKRPLPEAMLQDAELYAGCISGAIPKKEYLEAIMKAGFTNVTVQKERGIQLPATLLQKYSIPEDESGLIESITVTGEK